MNRLEFPVRASILSAFSLIFVVLTTKDAERRRYMGRH